MGEFILFFVTIFSFFFLQLDYFTKMRNIFLFFYLPCVILEAKTFQRKTDMETDGVASPARRNQLDRQRHPPGRGRSWSTWVNDYKDMMYPSKCTSRAHDHGIAVPCVDGRRMGCRHRNPIGDKYGYRMCWRDQSGSGCLYTINTSVARVTMSASMSGGITTNMEPLLVDMLLTARVEAFTMRYEEGYGPTVDSRRNGRSHAQSVTN